MISRDELRAYLDIFLSCSNYKDYCPNGLQVEGREQIATICTAVTASEKTIEIAADLKADALLVHHGFFWRGEPAELLGAKRRRLGKLMQADINLLAYHLPLDCHPTLGNNACLAKFLAAQSIKTYPAMGVADLLWTGKLKQSAKAEEFNAFLEKIFNRKPLHIAGSTKAIHNIAWCSGGAQDLLELAASVGADAYISGEVSERNYYQAIELGIHYFACGHHATERFGIQALAEHVCEKFNLSQQFIDSENPI